MMQCPSIQQLVLVVYDPTPLHQRTTLEEIKVALTARHGDKQLGISTKFVHSK